MKSLKDKLHTLWTEYLTHAKQYCAVLETDQNMGCHEPPQPGKLRHWGTAYLAPGGHGSHIFKMTTKSALNMPECCGKLFL